MPIMLPIYRFVLRNEVGYEQPVLVLDRDLVFFQWAVKLGEMRYPNQSFYIAYRDGPIIGGLVHH